MQYKTTLPSLQKCVAITILKTDSSQLHPISCGCCLQPDQWLVLAKEVCTALKGTALTVASQEEAIDRFEYKGLSLVCCWVTTTAPSSWYSVSMRGLPVHKEEPTCWGLGNHPGRNSHFHSEIPIYFLNENRAIRWRGPAWRTLIVSAFSCSGSLWSITMADEAFCWLFRSQENFTVS